ncbi:MAG: redoxin domain-containing protein [Candidatus Latescibacteria bacterium]|nr:redoxin domain-containing protein [Candidatus Latescibacterota bacterium]
MDYISHKLKSINLSTFHFHVVGIGLGIVAVIVFGAIGVPQSSIVQPLYNEQLPWRTEAPNIRLPTASGDSVEMKELLGKNLGLVFMTPTCEYSQDLKRELIETIKEPPVDQLFFVSGGTAAANDNSPEADKTQARFTSRFSVVQDTTGKIFRAYKISGVPSAYWISEAGVVMDFAVGFGPTLQLINRIADSR